MELSLALAFLAGVASFVTPCVLALVPIYLAVLAEAAVTTPGADLASVSGGSSGVAVAAPARIGRGPVMAQAALFTLGFSAVFVLLGVSVGIIGTALFREPIVRQLTGVLVVVIGLLMTGWFGPLLDRIPNPSPSVELPAGRATRALGLGALVGIGWTPCIGPVLGAILAMGASSQDVGTATVLLVAYAAGLAVPFLAVAAFLPRAQPVLRWLRAHERPIRVVSGLAVAGIGVLIFFDAFTRMAGLFGQFFL